jgi:beta-glucanase (GH16 family)
VVPLLHGNDGPLGQLYGRYVIRFRADALRGYKIAWLLWPDSETWPRDGEISAFLHRQGATANNDQDAFFSGVAVSGDWHTAVIEWTPEAVQFILDQRLLGTSTNRIPNTPMHWVIQTETNLDGFQPDDSVAGHLQVDWVAVYTYSQPAR